MPLSSGHRQLHPSGHPHHVLLEVAQGTPGLHNHPATMGTAGFTPEEMPGKPTLRAFYESKTKKEHRPCFPEMARSGEPERLKTVTN